MFEYIYYKFEWTNKNLRVLFLLERFIKKFYSLDSIIIKN